jgi:hypothetical protein
VRGTHPDQAPEGFVLVIILESLSRCFGLVRRERRGRAILVHLKNVDLVQHSVSGVRREGQTREENALSGGLGQDVVGFR